MNIFYFCAFSYRFSVLDRTHANALILFLGEKKGRLGSSFFHVLRRSRREALRPRSRARTPLERRPRARAAASASARARERASAGLAVAAVTFRRRPLHACFLFFLVAFRPSYLFFFTRPCRRRFDFPDVLLETFRRRRVTENIAAGQSATRIGVRGDERFY